MEIHHILPSSDGGGDDYDNAIPLCFDCHAEVQSYNANHPKGRRFTANELRRHRDEWYRLCREERIPHIFPGGDARWACTATHVHLSVDSDSSLWYEYAEEQRNGKYNRHFHPADWFYCIDVIEMYRQRESPRTSETSMKVLPFTGLSYADRIMFEGVNAYFCGCIAQSASLSKISEFGHFVDCAVEQFYEYTIRNTWAYDFGFKFNLGILQELMPSHFQWETLRHSDPLTFSLLQRYRYRFLRTSDPVFDFIVENDTDNSTVITQLNVHVKDRFSSLKGPSGGGGLAPIATYRMDVDFNAPCNSMVLDPPIALDPRSAARFKVQFRDFYQNATDNNLVVSFEFLFMQKEPILINDVYLDF